MWKGWTHEHFSSSLNEGQSKQRMRGRKCVENDGEHMYWELGGLGLSLQFSGHVTKPPNFSEAQYTLTSVKWAESFVSLRGYGEGQMI